MDFDIKLFKQIRENKEVEALHIKETIKKVGSEWEVVSHKGKSVGKYPTKKEALERLRQVEYFKAHPKNEAKEDMKEGTTTVEPTTLPTTKPDQKPITKPRTPLAPQPNIQPKPKAMNRDLELFKKMRENKKVK